MAKFYNATLLSCILGYMFSSSDMSSATILPENLPVFDLPQKDRIDDNLKKWIEVYTNDYEFNTIDDIDKMFNKEDKISAFYALILNPKIAEGMKLIPKYEQIKSELDSIISQNTYHPLHDYILSEIVKSNLYDKQTKKKVAKYWGDNNDISCARRNEIGNEFSQIGRPLKQKNKVKNLLKQIENYQDKPFKSRTFRKFIKNSKRNELKRMADILFPSFSQYKSLQPLTRKYLGKESKSQISIKVRELGKYRRRGLCTKARNILKGISASHEKYNLDVHDLISHGKNLALCYRKHGNIRTYIEGWDHVQGILKKDFGSDAVILTENQKAKIFWSVNDYKQAKSIIADVLIRFSLTPEKPESLAKTHYLLAQLYEDEKRLLDSVANYKNLIVNHPQTEVYDALKAIILIDTERNNWREVLVHSKVLMSSQDSLPESSRDVSKLGFALFWGGRAAYRLSNLDLAREYWKRLAIEFYSTYYGALGHYLLEMLEGKVLALQPSINQDFDEEKVLYEPFKPEHVRRIDRIKLLLLVGKRDMASCEVMELGRNTTDAPQKADVARALLYYATGDWLRAIRTYGGIPRSLRKNQPRGMERILFPVKYKDEITVLADRLNIDPFLVISLIRQESLFNPKAYSPAGAIGLMQMLRTTANLEAKRLSETYVIDKKEKKSLLKKTQSKWKLFDEDTNLKLGIHHLYSLLKKYGSSVFTLSAYNAGPGRLKSWKNRFDSDDLLLFTEKIPFKETRGYVKLILRNYFYYKKWYGGKDPQMPHLNPILLPVLSSLHYNDQIFLDGFSNNDLVPWFKYN